LPLSITGISLQALANAFWEQIVGGLAVAVSQACPLQGRPHKKFRSWGDDIENGIALQLLRWEWH
jgi:hypothetical protein